MVTQLDDGLTVPQGLQLIQESDSAKHLLAYGLRALRTAAFIETTRDPIMTMLSIGVEKMLKLGLGLNHLAATRCWLPLVVLKNEYRHDLLKMEGLFLDGLQEWTRLSSVTVRVDTDAHHSTGPRASVQVASTSGPSWRDQALDMSISTRWLIPQGRSPLLVHDDAALRSVASHPIAIDEHLDAHRTIRNLVSLVFGAPAHYRGHELTHPDFAPPAFSPPEDPGAPRTHAAEFFHHTTLADEAAPQPGSHAFFNPIIPFDEVGAAGLEAWTAACRRNPRAVVLAVGLLRRRPAIEDLLVNTCMAIEALGRSLTEVEDEEQTLNRGNPTFTTYAFRCLDRAGFTADTFGVPVQRVARAISRRYADTKHPNTSELPDSRATLVVAQIAILALRICLVAFASRTASITDRHGIDRNVADVVGRASELGIDLEHLLG